MDNKNTYKVTHMDAYAAIGMLVLGMDLLNKQERNSILETLRDYVEQQEQKEENVK